MEEKYQEIKKIVEKELSSSAHDLDHVSRVYNLCLKIAENESNVDLEILKTAALLHDIARVREDKDNSRQINHAILGAEMAERIMEELGFHSEKINHVKECITSHRFRSGGSNEPQTKEAKILFDADKLDMLGSIGIARSYIIAGENNQKIFSDIIIDDYIKQNLEGGKSNGKIKDISKHTPNLEFETKLKFFLDKLYTEKGKAIGKERLSFTIQFYNRLKKEITGSL